jgi:predicted membrane channel-forming protein YqfA (hemolysin III family)
MPVNVKTKNTEQNAHMCSALATESPLHESTYREHLVSPFCNPVLYIHMKCFEKRSKWTHGMQNVAISTALATYLTFYEDEQSKTAQDTMPSKLYQIIFTSSQIKSCGYSCLYSGKSSFESRKRIVRTE